MLKLSDFEKPLVAYKRKPSKMKAYVSISEDGTEYIPKLQYVKGEIRGIVVSLGYGIIGWSLCNKKDHFDFKLGMDKALNRALIAATLSDRNRSSFYLKVPTTLLQLFQDMEERSMHFYNKEV